MIIIIVLYYLYTNESEVKDEICVENVSVCLQAISIGSRNKRENIDKLLVNPWMDGNNT